MATTTASRLLELVNDRSGQPTRVKFHGWEYPLGESVTGKHYFQADVPVDAIQRDEEAQPRSYDPEQGRKIAKSIQEKVLMQPILARYDESLDRILVTEGQHRWRAVKDILKGDVIPALVYIDLDKYVALLCGLEANAEDRARALSGGDVARKTHALMEEYSDLINQETGKLPSEVDVLNRMGQTTKTRHRQFIVGKIAEDVRQVPGSKLGPFISDRQGKSQPVTMRNLMHFLDQLVKTSAVDTKENLRNEELGNVLRVTNLLAEALFEGGKWTPEAPEEPTHIHATNVCRNFPFEILGYFIAKTIDTAGGAETSTGACYAPSARIHWDKVEIEVRKLVSSPIWDQPHVALSRRADDIKEAIANAMR